MSFVGCGCSCYGWWFVVTGGDGVVIVVVVLFLFFFFFVVLMPKYSVGCGRWWWLWV